MSEANLQQLPKGWVEEELSAIAQINPRLDRCIIADSVAVDFVPMRAVEPEGGGLLRPEISTFGSVKKGYIAFLPGDVIMAKITPCMENGKTCVVPNLPGAACFGSTEFHVIRVEPGMDPRWIANFLLQHSTRHAAQRQMMGGVGQMRVPTAFLESLKLAVPPNAEQKRILDVLDERRAELEAAGAALEWVRTKLKHYCASVLKAAVEGALTADWRTQHSDTEPASALLQRILVERRRRWEEAQLEKFRAAGKEPPKNWKAKYKEPVVADGKSLPELPEGWCWGAFDQLLWLLRSGTAETSGRTRTAYPVLKSSAVRHGTIDFQDLNYFDGSKGLVTQNLLQQGDFLVTRLSGSVDYVGCSAVVGQLMQEEIQYPDRIFCAKLVPSSNGTYLTYCFRHPRARKWLEAAAKSTAGHQRISMTDLRPLAIPLPPLAEQAAIVEAVESQLSVIDHLEGDLEAKLKSAQALRQSILLHAFTGQLVPQDPNDEPASELLKRIAAEREERIRVAAAAKEAVKKAKPAKVAKTRNSRKRAAARS